MDGPNRNSDELVYLHPIVPSLYVDYVAIDSARRQEIHLTPVVDLAIVDRVTTDSLLAFCDAHRGRTCA